MRQLEPSFATAEWGFAIGSPFWGTGLFAEGARMVVDFTFETVGCIAWRRGRPCRTAAATAGCASSGAVQEGVLRKSFLRRGEYLDQVLWSILDEDWRQAKAVWGYTIH